MMAVAHPFSKPVFSDTAKHLDARNFLVRFESYAAAVPWSRDHWHTEVANCLEGEPLRWFYGGLRQTVSIHSPHRNSVQDWDEFKEYFMQAYRPEARHSVRVKTFEALKQKTNETLTNFWHRCGTSINEMFHGNNSPEYVQSSRKVTHAVTGASLTIPSAALFDLLCGGEAEFRRKASSPDTLQELMADLYTFVIRLTNESQGIYKNIISKNMLVSGVQSYLKDKALTSHDLSLPQLLKELRELEGARGMHVHKASSQKANSHKVHMISNEAAECSDSDTEYVDAAKQVKKQKKGKPRAAGQQKKATIQCEFCSRYGHKEATCLLLEKLMVKFNARRHPPQKIPKTKKTKAQPKKQTKKGKKKASAASVEDGDSTASDESSDLEEFDDDAESDDAFSRMEALHVYESDD